MGIAIRGECIESGYDCQNDRLKLHPCEFDQWNLDNPYLGISEIFR